MSERYIQLYQLETGSYQDGAPVVIVAGALLKDTVKNTVLVQLKYMSITDKVIKALKVMVQPLSVSKEPLGVEVGHLYLDINIQRDEMFGQKEPILLPDSSTRHFRTRVAEVTFDDDSKWECTDEIWMELHRPETLERYFNSDNELIKQYKLEYGQDSTVFPREELGLWYCSCGKLNRPEESECHCCKKDKSKLFTFVSEKLVDNKETRVKNEAYRNAVQLGEQNSIDLLTEAIAILSGIQDWRDAKEKIDDYQKRIDHLTEQQRVAAEERAKAERIRTEAAQKKRKRIAIISAVTVISCLLLFALVTKVIIPKQKLDKAMGLIDEGDYDAAYALLDELGNSDAIISNKYDRAVALEEAGETQNASKLYFSILDYKDASERVRNLLIDSNKHITIDAGLAHTVALCPDGTVVATGYNKYGQCDVGEWKDIVAISAGKYHTVGLRLDGTVVAAGDNEYGQCDVSEWKEIVAVSAGGGHTVGICTDGTVVSTGYNEFGQCDVNEWKTIVAVSAGAFHTVGLCTDGTVVATGNNEFGQCDVNKWNDIAMVSAGGGHTVGLRSDGSVVATGYNEFGQCNVRKRKNIVAVSAGEKHTVALRSYGAVIAAGSNEYNQSDVSDWKDIIAVSAGGGHTVGLRSDGTVVAAGYKENGQCDVSEWVNMKLPNGNKS